MVVSIILSILKIIGIVLLCILGIILLFLLLMLFIPIRYKVMAEGNLNDTVKECQLTAKISWLLFWVYGKYAYPSEEGPIVKVGPFTVYGGKEKPKKEKKKNKKKKREKDAATDVETVEEDKPDESKNVETVFDSTETEKEGTGKRTLKEKIIYTRQKIYDKINEIYKKIKYILTNIEKYLDILKSEEFKDVFKLCKTSFVRMFRMVKPRKVKINGTVGMKSPDQTGYICALIGVISPYFKKQIHVEPDFENFVVNGNVLIKGRMFMIVFMIIAVKAFFNKNIRRLIKMICKEDISNE